MTYTVKDEATAKQIAALDPLKAKVKLVRAHAVKTVPAKEKGGEPVEVAEYVRDIKIIEPLTAAEAELAAINKQVKEARKGIDHFKKDVVVVDEKGKRVVKVIDRPKAEADALMANIIEPAEATSVELAKVDSLKQKVVTELAGFADGTVRTIKQIIDLSPAEIEAVELSLKAE